MFWREVDRHEEISTKKTDGRSELGRDGVFPSVQQKLAGLPRPQQRPSEVRLRGVNSKTQRQTINSQRPRRVTSPGCTPFLQPIQYNLYMLIQLLRSGSSLIRPSKILKRYVFGGNRDIFFLVSVIGGLCSGFHWGFPTMLKQQWEW